VLPRRAVAAARGAHPAALACTPPAWAPRAWRSAGAAQLIKRANLGSPCWAPGARTLRKGPEAVSRGAAAAAIRRGPLRWQRGGVHAHRSRCCIFCRFQLRFVLPDAPHEPVVFSVHCPWLSPGCHGALGLFLQPSSPAHDPAVGWLKKESGQRRHMVWRDASIQALRVWDRVCLATCRNRVPLYLDAAAPASVVPTADSLRAFK